MYIFSIISPLCVCLFGRISIFPAFFSQTSVQAMRESYGRSKRNCSLASTKRNWPSFAAFYPSLICLTLFSLSISCTFSLSHSFSQPFSLHSRDFRLSFLLPAQRRGTLEKFQFIRKVVMRPNAQIRTLPPLLVHSYQLAWCKHGGIVLQRDVLFHRESSSADIVNVIRNVL